jgi:microcystin-dependent protein
MGVRHSKEGRGAVASAADYAIPAATSVTVAASNGFRQKVEIYVTGATSVVLAYNAVATSTVNSFPLASNAVPYLDVNYTGPITAAIPSAAASSALRVREVSS